jgi:hypothetical protein
MFGSDSWPENDESLSREERQAAKIARMEEEASYANASTAPSMPLDVQQAMHKSMVGAMSKVMEDIEPMSVKILREQVEKAKREREVMRQSCVQWQQSYLAIHKEHNDLRVRLDSAEVILTRVAVFPSGEEKHDALKHFQRFTVNNAAGDKEG